MTTKKNLAASVRARLLNRARGTARPFQEVLQYYSMERFLYRLACSPHAPGFILKGALMMRVWDAPDARPTKDVDLLGRVSNEPGQIELMFKDILAQSVEPDGMEFHADTLVAQSIKSEADSPGIRLRFLGTLASARIQMQVDIGFGDIVFPAAVEIRYPTLLDFPEPRLRGYPPETAVAEKFEAMVSLGTLNSRMKDFYDVWLLARQRDFDGPTLLSAVTKTFERRSTEVIAEPVSLSEPFVSSERTGTLWRAFRRHGGVGDAPESFAKIAKPVLEFLRPVAIAVRDNARFSMKWSASGPWKRK